MSGTFAKLIDPLSCQSFVSAYWNQTPAQIKRERLPETLDELSTESLKDLIRSGALLESDVRVVSGRGKVSAPDLMEGNNPRLSPSRVERLIDKGASLVLLRPQRFFPRLRSCIADLRLETGLEVDSNLYLSRMGHETYGWHWDGHHILAVQISGTKTWQIDTQTSFRRGSGSAPEHARSVTGPAEISTQPGESLYVPSGCLHTAASKSDASLHLTIQIHSPTYADLIREFIRTIETRPGPLSTPIPPFWNRDENLMMELLHSMREGCRAELGQSFPSDLVLEHFITSARRNSRAASQYGAL